MVELYCCPYCDKVFEIKNDMIIHSIDCKHEKIEISKKAARTKETKDYKPKPGYS